MADKRISYSVRDFASLRTELINMVKTYYPDLINNFNDASLFSVFLDMNAAVADNLHYHIDRSLQETVLQYAQEKSSVFNIARTYGLKIPGQRPSVALADFSIIVPANGDKEDERYLGLLRRGSQVIGAGQVFEVANDIDFSSPYNSSGFPNRLKVPNFDSNNNIVSYTITKRDVVINGTTKILKRTITATDSRPFFELFLPERNVLGITSVLEKDGTNYANVPSSNEFLSTNGRWYEVDALIQDRVFVEDPSKVSDSPGIKVGKYIQADNRFITEYTPEGFLKMTFGGGNNSANDQLREFARSGINTLPLENYLNNFGLGRTLKPNTTLFIQYRVGGGLSSNIGVNVLNQLGTISFFVNGPSESINSSVVSSLNVTNVTAAIGGANFPTLEEVRGFVGYNFSAQKRAVTIDDYNSIIRSMPSKFGSPSKVAIVEEDNKIKVKLLSYDSNGALGTEISNTLIRNISEYLSNYRMINDYILIESGEVIDLSFDISVVLDSSQNQGSLVSTIIDQVSTFMNPELIDMGKDINLSELYRIIQGNDGVVSVSDIKVFNKVGGQYSSSETSMSYVDSTTKEIAIQDQTIFALPNQIYQIRFPNRDIVIKVKNQITTQIS